MQNSTLLTALYIAWSVSSSRMLADEPANADAPVATAVPAAFLAPWSAMFESGFEGPSGLDDARRHYTVAHRLRSEDPRVEYGFAVVLLKNFQQAEALTHLQAALEADPAYLPAWRLQFRETVRQREFDELFEQLLALSDVVGVFSENPPPEPRRQEIAEWLGRGAGYLEGPLGNYEVAEQAVRVSRRLRARLGEKLLDRFEAGRLAVSRRQQLLQSRQLAAVADAEIERNADLQETQAARDDLDDEREQLEMSRDEWDAWIAEQVDDIDSQLEALHKQYGQVSGDQSDINRAALQVRAEIMQITTLAQQSAAGQTLITANPFILEGQLIARQAELDQYAAEYNSLEQERLQILAGAQSLFGERDASVTRYRQATGNAAGRIQQIDRWDRRLEKEAEETGRSDLLDARQVRNLRRQIQNWATYDPFDLNAQPERLLSEFQTQTP